MTVTQHQRIACWFTDWREASDERLAKLYAAGARVLPVHLQDHGEVPREQVDHWKSLKWRVWGACRPSGDPVRPKGGVWEPVDTARWLYEEKLRLGLQGISCNFEADIQGEDLASNGRWSETFATAFRGFMPTIPAQLNTYPVEGLRHEAYIARGFRVSVQTYSPENALEWSPSWIKGWCQRIGWEPGRIKVTLPVHRIDGARLPVDTAMDSMQWAQIVGCTLFPTEAAMDVLDDYLVPLVRSLIAGRCAY